MIYFDHNAGTPYTSSVKKFLQTDIASAWQNPSAVYPKAQLLHQQITKCRTDIANHLNCSAKHLFFTSGATESINTILSQNTLHLNGVHTIITSLMEHQTVLKKVKYLTNPPPGYCDKQNNINQNLISAFYIANNKQGEIDFNHLEKLCAQNPKSLVSLLSSNNETGVITNITAVSKIAKKYNCLLHVDAVQSLGKTNIDLTNWDVDFASFSGHKIGSMKGVGLLYAKKPFAPLMYGGGQERGLRPGSYNFPAVYSLALAMQDINLSKMPYVQQLKNYFEHQLSMFKVNCFKAKRLPNTSSVYCMGVSAAEAVFYLAQKSICVSAGSACNAGALEPSHVITALGIDDYLPAREYAKCCIRVSFASSNTQKEVDILLTSLRELALNKHHLSPSSAPAPAAPL